MVVFFFLNEYPYVLLLSWPWSLAVGGNASWLPPDKRSSLTSPLPGWSPWKHRQQNAASTPVTSCINTGNTSHQHWKYCINTGNTHWKHIASTLTNSKEKTFKMPLRHLVHTCRSPRKSCPFCWCGQWRLAGACLQQNKYLHSNIVFTKPTQSILESTTTKPRVGRSDIYIR